MFDLLQILLGLGAFAWLLYYGPAFLERRLMYHPTGHRVAPASAGLHGVEEVLISAPDGTHVVAWYAKAASGQPTLLYFHGNAGTLFDRADRIQAFQDHGRGIMMMSYRGYSGSQGVPSERNNVGDAKRAYEVLVARGVLPGDILIYGESLGSGIAVQVAAEKPAAGIILDAPYTSIVDVGEICYPLLPARSVMRDRYETMQFLDKVKMPLLVVHGEADAVIPVEMGRTIARSAPGPAEIVTFPMAGHTDHGMYGSYEAINDWIDRQRALKVSSQQNQLREAN